MSMRSSRRSPPRPGIAATHIGGLTIHSWSGIGIKRHLSAYELDRIAQNERIVKRVRGASVLIIDEISMLSADTLGMVEAVCREIRANEKPFGGLQVILVGDFFQLPPVNRREAAEDAQDTLIESPANAGFAFSSHAWEALNPIVCYLHEQHRQEDEKFLEILSAIRHGEVEDEHREILLSRRASKAEGGRAQAFPRTMRMSTGSTTPSLPKYPAMRKFLPCALRAPIGWLRASSAAASRLKSWCSRSARA